MARLSLAQQIAQLEVTAVDHDPEDAYENRQLTAGIGNDEGDDAEDTQDGREHYVEVGPSSMRKLHEGVSDPKYSGIRTSRNKIFDEDEDLSDEEAVHPSQPPLERSSPSAAGGDPLYSAPNPFAQTSDGTDSGLESDNDDDKSDPRLPHTTAVLQGSSKISAAVEEGDWRLAETLRQTREHDRTKGRAVTHQLAAWDALLDVRIRLQKGVVSANQLPLPENLPQFTATDPGRTCMQSFLHTCMEMSDDISALRELYSSINDEITPPPGKKRRVRVRDTVDLIENETDIPLATEMHASMESSYHPTLIQTLSKWSQKVQSVAPTALLPSNKHMAFRNSLPGQTRTAADLIEETTSGGKAIHRTQVRRAGEKRRIGEDEAVTGTETPGMETLDVDHIFDDVDFYQQLLRDVIDSRSGKESMVGLDTADAWARKQKKALKADRSLANKDRQVRYDAHEKLQNYMVPVPVSAGGWHEEQIDELFASLLGKGFEGAAYEEPARQRREMIVDRSDIAQVVNGGDPASLTVF